MQEQGLTSITEASKFIKDHNLYALYASEASKAAQ
jgi:hypothetical protein